MKVTLATMRKVEGLGIEGQLVARGFYRTLFDVVADPKDWKKPICMSVGREVFDAEPDVMAHAVTFFTGAPCQIEERKDVVIVKCVGYRAGPAGDH